MSVLLRAVTKEDYQIDYNSTVGMLIDTIHEFNKKGIYNLLVYITTPNSVNEEDQQYLQGLLEDSTLPLEGEYKVQVK